MSSVSELIPVGGELPEGEEPLESPSVSSISQQTIRVGGIAEENAEGQKPLPSPNEVPEGQQQP